MKKILIWHTSNPPLLHSTPNLLEVKWNLREEYLHIPWIEINIIGHNEISESIFCMSFDFVHCMLWCVTFNVLVIAKYKLKILMQWNFSSLKCIVLDFNMNFKLCKQFSNSKWWQMKKSWDKIMTFTYPWKSRN